MKRLLTFAALMAAAALFAGELVLTDKGKPNAFIVLDQPDSPHEKLAAKELAAYVKKISGADLAGAKSGKVKIELAVPGKSRKTLPKNITAELDKAASEEAYCIGTAPGGRIIIAGKSPAGVLYGTYAFMEDILGVRFFHAHAESFPKTPTIRVKDFRIFRQPWLNQRMLNEWRDSVKPFTEDEFHIWMTRRALSWIDRNPSRRLQEYAPCGGQRNQAGRHLTFENSVPQKLFKTRPELFPLQNGKRVCMPRSQRCLSNPEVQKMLVDYIVSCVRKGMSFGIGFHDSTNGWCECDACRKMGTDDKGKYSISNYAHSFVSMIAGRVLKIEPKAELYYEMYTDFRTIPTIPGFKYPNRITGEFCPHGRCYVHTLENSECNATYYKWMQDWLKVSHIGVYDYYCYAETNYCPIEYTMAKDMKLYASRGVRFFKDDCSHRGIEQPLTNWPFYYLMSKLYWDVNLDVDKVLADAYDRYYGPAAKPMKEYHAYRRQLWESVPGHATYPGIKRYANCLLVPGMEKRLLGLLDQAEKLAAKDPEVLRRIRWDRTFLNQYWIKEAHKIQALSKGRKDIPVSRTSGKFVIDGKLNEEAWRTAPILTGFLNTDNKAEAKEETRVRILYDDQYWYVGMEAMTEHSWGPLKAKYRKHDDKIWEDDCVEVFMVPPQGSYYHWIVNSLGAFYDAKETNPAFESGAEVKVLRTKDRYTVEMKIPVSCMGRKAIREGEAWKLHFTRDARNLQPPGDRDSSSVDGVGSHKYLYFRSAALGIAVARNGSFAKLVNVSERDKKNRHITSARLPEFWSVHHGGLTQDKNGKNIIFTRGSVIYSYLSYPRSAKKTRFSGFAEISGKGKAQIYFSGCIRLPGDKRGYGNELQKDIGTFQLTEKPQIIPIQVEVEPYSQYYIEFKTNSTLNVHRVVLSR